MQTIYRNGSLSLDEQDQSRMNYIITDALGKQTSITDILDTIYNSNNSIKKLVRVMGKIYDSNHTFCGFESLHITKDKYGTYSYHIGNFPIDIQLFELACDNSKIELLLEDYTDSISEFIDDMDTTEDLSDDTTNKA